MCRADIAGSAPAAAADQVEVQSPGQSLTKELSVLPELPGLKLHLKA